jgi:tRNA modification GTPase
MKKISCSSLNNNKLSGTVPLDTIVAISTPIGKSGIGIVRLSGSQAFAIADKIFVNSNGLRPSQFPTHTIHYGWIKEIDEVLLTVMRAPRTYTREDIVEINCHSGIVVLKRILELVLNSGARLALPGEFTKRAFLNGRIDLAQAEAVLDVINSQTQISLNAALGQLQGRLSQKINMLRRCVLDILTQLEATIDFADQDINPLMQDEILAKMKNVTEDIKQLLDSADKGIILRQGVTCVICGKPNVGKSSLLNALLKRERAIVTALPGTTRDSLEETVDLSGVPLRLVDTAGIMKGCNIAEQKAVEKSRQQLEGAHLVLLVLDASQKMTSEDILIKHYIANKPALIVLNKQDLPIRIDIDRVKEIFPNRKILTVSALTGIGMDRLEKKIAENIWEGNVTNCSEDIITNIRHKEALKQAYKFLKRAMRAKKAGQSAEIIALEVKESQSYLSEIIGQIHCEDILERIFSQFCVGK